MTAPSLHPPPDPRLAALAAVAHWRCSRCRGRRRTPPPPPSPAPAPRTPPRPPASAPCWMRPTTQQRPAQFLTADQAFQVAARAAGPDSVRLDWQIADGYYLYRSRIKVKTASPVQLGALALPEGKSQTDEYFGTQQIYEHTLSATLPVARAARRRRRRGPRCDLPGLRPCGPVLPADHQDPAVTLPPAGARRRRHAAAPARRPPARASSRSRIGWRR